MTVPYYLTFTGAPTANGSKIYLIFRLCVTAKPNLPVASPLQFLGRYLSRRSEVREANPLNIYCALPLLTILLRVEMFCPKFIPSAKPRVFFWKKDKNSPHTSHTPHTQLNHQGNKKISKSKQNVTKCKV